MVNDLGKISAFFKFADQAHASGAKDLASNLLWRAAQRCWWSNASSGPCSNVLAGASRLKLLELDPRGNTVPPEILKAVQSGDPPPADLADNERRAFDELKVAVAKRRAYAAFMATRPQTLYGIADSPVGLAAWMIDPGDGWGQPAVPITSAILGRL